MIWVLVSLNRNWLADLTLISTYKKVVCVKDSFAAIHGVTNILARYWTIFASDDIEKFMKLMILHLANDMASPKVRIAVVKGMIHLVQNCPRAHGYLKKILPKLQDLLFDSNESVKLSLIDLLISVKSIKTIQFWQICPLENILDRLMKDKKSVSAKITQLLFNSFFPLDQVRI